MPTDYDPFRPDEDVEEPKQDVTAEDAQQVQEKLDEQQPDHVPSGSTKEVLQWVGDDKDKARRALEKEEAHEQPRKGLVRELNEVLEKDDSSTH